MSDAEAKLAAARTRLILDQPFLGALVLRLPLKPAPWCRTTATDARALYYNPGWIDSLSTAQAQFALAHEALHCALGHFARRGHRLRRKWDIACELAINPLLVDAGLVPPAEAIVLDVYRGMAAEEIYPCLDDNDNESETLDDHPWEGETGGGEGPPAPLTAPDRERLQQQWQRHLAAAAQRAREVGKLSGQLARLVDAALASQASWRALLAQCLSQAARDDYTWQRPSRRDAGANGEAIWPGLRSHGGDIHVAIDVSGSVTDQDMADFLGELNALKGALPVRILLFACDSELAAGAPWTFEPWDELRLPRQFAGGGGTAFAPVFDWIAQNDRQPDALVYFTDAEGEFPAVAPSYPVLWLVKGKAAVPWGRRIQLN
ncbi:MAG: VWA-like domain-containing protein [Pseudomonadota bacterium]